VVIITKKSGVLEEFDVRKLEHSLLNAGASRKMVSIIVKRILPQLYHKMKTTKIYDLAFKILKKMDYISASRFDLKGALLRLGKKGYAFEQFISHLLNKQGYKTETNIIVKGTCITHEIDILAQKKKQRILVECKHHGKPWIQLRIQTALYTYARFLDVQHACNAVMLVTNTKLSQQVIQYCKCKNMKTLAWKYPHDKGLNYAIEHFKLYPVTILQSLDWKTMQTLIGRRIVLAEELYDEKLLKDLQIQNKKKVMQEVKELCRL